MKSKVMGTFVLLALLVLAFGVVGQASAGGSTDGVIQDAQNGTVDKNWTASQVSAAIAYLKANPTLSQYSDAQGVLEDYLASLSGSGGSGPGVVNGAGQLAFTGAEIWLILIAGAGLLGGGLALKRRSRAER